jgi:GNAT superfamily N-acetyltransferase
MIELVSYSLDDKKTAAEILVETYAREPWNEKWTIERAEKRIVFFTTGEATRSYKILYDDEMVGFLFGRMDLIAEKDIFYLDELFISPNHQRKGYGRLALECLEMELKSNGVTSIELHTIEEDVGFYTKVGYKRSDLILFEKEI